MFFPLYPVDSVAYVAVSFSGRLFLLSGGGKAFLPSAAQERAVVSVAT